MIISFNAVRCLSPSLRKNQSNHVTWMSTVSCLKKKKKKKRVERVPRLPVPKEYGRDRFSSAIQDGVKHGQMRFIHSFILSHMSVWVCSLNAVVTAANSHINNYSKNIISLQPVGPLSSVGPWVSAPWSPCINAPDCHLRSFYNSLLPLYVNDWFICIYF